MQQWNGQKVFGQNLAGPLFMLAVRSFYYWWLVRVQVLYKAPRENSANDAIFPAEKLFGKMASASAFSKDSVNIVLNGGILAGDKVTGLLSIIKNTVVQLRPTVLNI